MNRQPYPKAFLLIACTILLVSSAYAEEIDRGQPIKPLSLDKAVEIARSDSKIIKEAASRYSAAVEEKKTSLQIFCPRYPPRTPIPDLMINHTWHITI